MVLMACTSQALTGHFSVLESKISLLCSLAFSLALKMYVLRMERVAGIWVAPRCATTHLCCRGLQDIVLQVSLRLKKTPANQQKNFEELCCPTTRPQSFSFELPVFMEPHCAPSLHSCTIVALCLLQQCVVTPPGLDGNVLPSLVFLLELMFQSFHAKLEIQLGNGLKRVL